MFLTTLTWRSARDGQIRLKAKDLTEDRRSDVGCGERVSTEQERVILRGEKELTCQVRCDQSIDQGQDAHVEVQEELGADAREERELRLDRQRVERGEVRRVREEIRVVRDGQTDLAGVRGRVGKRVRLVEPVRNLSEPERGRRLGRIVLRRRSDRVTQESVEWEIGHEQV